LSGRATQWRLTELKTPDPSGESIRPTRDFLSWDGTKFDPKKHFPRGQKSSGPRPRGEGAERPPPAGIGHNNGPPLAPDDSLTIPTFLLRGHADCVLGSS
jgi:hypothetical protein